MEPFTTVDRPCRPARTMADVDTDQIIPKQFLKRIERTGFGEFLFYDWRRRGGFDLLDRAEYAGAPILVAGHNFGCGSSREHAPWALEDFGFRAVIAPSFADIFRNNCTKIGILPVALPEEEVRALMAGRRWTAPDGEVRSTWRQDRHRATAATATRSTSMSPCASVCSTAGTTSGCTLGTRGRDLGLRGHAANATGP